MQSVTTIGLDIAKSVFQVHGVNADGNVVLRRQLKRRCVLAFFQKVPPPVRPWLITLVTLKTRTLGPIVERFIECAREVAKELTRKNF
jgi:transposase